MKPFPLLSRVVLAVSAVAFLAAACGDDDSAEGSTDDAVTITDSWSRQPADGQTATAVYGVVSNPTDTDLRIVSAASPVTDTVELHETLMDDDGVMSMVEVDEGFVVPAGGEFTFEPGGPHMMLLGIDPATYPESVEITLSFDAGSPLTFAAEVRAAEDDMDMDHSDMDDPDMDDEMDDETEETG